MITIIQNYRKCFRLWGIVTILDEPAIACVVNDSNTIDCDSVEFWCNFNCGREDRRTEPTWITWVIWFVKSHAFTVDGKWMHFENSKRKSSEQLLVSPAKSNCFSKRTMLCKHRAPTQRWDEKNLYCYDLLKASDIISI